MQPKPYLATVAITHIDGHIQRLDLHLTSSDDIGASMAAELAVLNHLRSLGQPALNATVLDVQAAG